MELGTKIRRMRIAKGYSQEYVAEHLCISQKSYSHMENEKTKLSLQRLNQLAIIFGTSTIKILSNEGDQPKEEKPNQEGANRNIFQILQGLHKQIEELRAELRAHSQK